MPARLWELSKRHIRPMTKSGKSRSAMASQSTGQLARAYIAAHRDPSKPVPAAALQALDATGAMAVQGEVLRQLGETASVAKVSAPAGGPALAAPIIDSWVTRSGGTLQLNGRNMMGLEIEI